MECDSGVRLCQELAWMLRLCGGLPAARNRWAGFDALKGRSPHVRHGHQIGPGLEDLQCN